MDQPLLLPGIAEGEDKSSPFVNCIRNNYKHIKKWAKRTASNCFRIYDKDIHSYPLAIDFYAGRFCIHYFSKSNDNDEPPEELVQEVTKALADLFGIAKEAIFWRTRARTKTTRQYEKLGGGGEFFTVQEYGVLFKVNLVDYLDTGLFLDHRETRRLVAAQSKGKRLLNLFAYTCSFSVHAAKAGAAFTKSVDLSNTYLDWGAENFRLNSIPLKNNAITRADCLKFMDQEIRQGERYDLIVIDPPTISRSKKMDQLFDIQVDYVFLIEKALRLLNKQGCIFFSTNSRRFVFDPTKFSACQVEEITRKTLPLDFKDPKIHRCWKISLLLE